MKPSLKDPVFNRGCCKMRGEYEAGQDVLNRSACKLNEFNWMKDYEGVPAEGKPLIAEVRFKNDHKDFYTYPAELDLHEGDLVGGNFPLLGQVLHPEGRGPGEAGKGNFRSGRFRGDRLGLFRFRLAGIDFFRGIGRVDAPRKQTANKDKGEAQGNYAFHQTFSLSVKLLSV